MKLVPRAKWGARAPRYTNPRAMSEPSTVHWNGPAVRVRGSLTWGHEHCASLVRGVQNFHMDGNGWSDIAYNFVVCPHGYTFEGRGLNTINGANGTNSGNRSSHAVMVLAGQGNPFPEAEKVAVKETVHYISNTTTAPNRAIGHRDHKATECPGDQRYTWVRQGMPIASVTPPPKATPPASAPKKGKKKMFSFLFRTTKSSSVWLVSGDMMVKQWVQSPTELAGFKSLLELNGGSGDVCALSEKEPISIAVAQIPAVGPVPKGYTGPRTS